MAPLSKQTAVKTAIPTGKQRNYSEIVEFLDANWTTYSPETSLQNLKKLDKALGGLTHKTNAIVVTGTNGKSLTAHFTTALLRDEGLRVGTFYAPHILTYNERFHVDGETIANKKFTELANHILTVAQTDELELNTYELLTAMALYHFATSEADVAVIELDANAVQRFATFYTPSITAITRVTTNTLTPTDAVTTELINDITAIVREGTHVISADQSKLNLQTMLDRTQEKGGVWGMPIRKLATLEYPFEQLHGRCAALAERIARIYINDVLEKDDAVVTGSSLLTKQKGRRGRPTLEAKRQSELNPKKTMDQFWREVHNTLPGRFQLLDKEKPTLLLDNANNLDALSNVLLGIRLLHYQRPLKGLALIIACDNPEIDTDELVKALRYFFKKTSGSVIFCPTPVTPGTEHNTTWNPEAIANTTQTMKIKGKATATLKEAFQYACKLVDDRHGLVVITGSSAIISEYWQQKGVKKF